MRESFRILTVLLTVVAVCWVAGACGSFTTFNDNWDGNCFGCTQVPDFSRTYDLALVPGGVQGSGWAFFAYDAGPGASGHHLFNIIKLYDNNAVVKTQYVFSGDGPKGSGNYDISVVDQLTPHINTDSVFDVSGF